MRLIMVTESGLLSDFAKVIGRSNYALILYFEQLLVDIISRKRLSDVNIGVSNEGEFWKFLHIISV